MPPKRSSTDSAGTGGTAKKSKTNSSSVAADVPATNPSRNKRWAAVSGSANADDHYLLITKDPVEAYEYICLCRLPFERSSGSDDEDDEDDEGDEDNDGGDGNACDGGDSCVCSKQASEHPDHPYLITFAGYHKFVVQQIHIQLRDPDNFRMYTFNDHAGYGVLQVVQNLFLDFEEAKDNWKEQWAVCEATVLLGLNWCFEPIMTIDDGECLEHTIQLIGRMFLAMLARLEREGLLSESSEVKDIGLVMAEYIKFAGDIRSAGMGVLQAPTAKKAKFNPAHFDDYILGYANKFSILVKGPKDIEELLAGCDRDVELPAASDRKDDPWGWDTEFKVYKKLRSVCGIFHGNKTSVLGGDNLDITTWTSAERKAASFKKKDPLGEKGIQAIKDGMVMKMG